MSLKINPTIIGGVYSSLEFPVSRFVLVSPIQKLRRSCPLLKSQHYWERMCRFSLSHETVCNTFRISAECF